MKPEIGQGLRWAAGLGLGVGLMLGAACSLLWKPVSLSGGDVAQEVREPGKAVATAEEGNRFAGGDRQESARRIIAFVVLPGMTFQDIADLLVATGAVADREAFLARARELNALHRAQPGLYVLNQVDPNQPLTHDEIIVRLVRGPGR
ncbi:MAG TPA: hypothetical protein VIL07_03365 [Symbiobacteriaceae bacterium]